LKQSIICRQGIKVYVHGVFDLLHYGHIRFLEKAKDLGNILIVGLVTDENAEKIKGKTILDYNERFEVISAIKCIDLVIKQYTEDPTENLRLLGIDILCRADDYRGSPPGTDFIEANGGKVVRIPYTEGISTSEIKRRINNA